MSHKIGWSKARDDKIRSEERQNVMEWIANKIKEAKEKATISKTTELIDYWHQRIEYWQDVEKEWEEHDNKQ